MSLDEPPKTLWGAARPPLLLCQKQPPPNRESLTQHGSWRACGGLPRAPLHDPRSMRIPTSKNQPRQHQTNTQ